jgi:hypothetical protein
MAPGLGIKAPVPRTRTGEIDFLKILHAHAHALTYFLGYLTCRKRKVKCNEIKPHCRRYLRLQREFIWSNQLQVIPHRQSHNGLAIILTSRSTPSLQINRFCGQNFVIKFPNINRISIPYIYYFSMFYCRFLIYSNDNKENPFQEKLIPLISLFPVLLHLIAVFAAGHLTRSQPLYKMVATKYYLLALYELKQILSDLIIACLDTILGAYLLLYIYKVIEISYLVKIYIYFL